MADMEYTVDLNEAIQAFNNLNNAINQVNASGRSSKKKLQPIIDDIENLRNVLTGAPEEINAIVAALKNIAINPTTMKGSLKELSTALDNSVKNMKRGTATMTAIRNQETFSLKRELDRQAELLQKSAIKRQQSFDQEQGMKTRQQKFGAAAGYPRTQSLGDPELVEALQAGRELKKAREAELESSIIYGALKEGEIARANKAQADLQKDGTAAFKRGLAEGTAAVNQEKELLAAAVDQRIKQFQEGEERTKDLLTDSAETRAAQIQANIAAERQFQSLASKERDKADRALASQETKAIADAKARRAAADADRDKTERELLRKERARRDELAQGVREASNFDSFAASDNQRQTAAEAEFKRIETAAKAHAKELKRLNFSTFAQGLRDGAKIVKEDLDLRDLAFNANIKRIKEEEKAQEKATREFQAEVDKRIKAARAFEDAKRTGLSKGQFDTLSADKLDNLQTGARISSNKPKDEFDVAAIKQMAQNYRETKSAQAEVIAEAKKLGIPLRDNAETVKEFTLSWRTMGRILIAQAFSQVFFSVQNALRQSVDSAQELYNAVAEIQTITERASQGALAYNSALQSVISVSSKINFTPQDTANAYYETLSNQIGENVSQITQFIVEAGNLGKVTRSSLADSTDAISSVMNAYNLSISDASKISSQLFTLVDQGRFKLEDIANTLGNVSVPASQLGIDFDNVAAGLAAISIAGVPPRESMTLFRNVMFKLIDPTKAMTSLFKEWGVSSGQAAIATFGFEGVLSKLSVAAREGQEEFQNLFGTTRAFRGGLGLTDENFTKYAKAVDAMRLSQENYGKIVEAYLKNPGEQYNKLLQQTSNEFLQIGLSVVNAVSAITDFTGSTEEGVFHLAELLGFLSKIGIVLGATATAFLVAATAGAAYTSAAAAAAGATTGLTVALAALSITPPVIVFTTIVAAATAATAALIVFSKTTAQVNGEIVAKSQQANKDIGAAYNEGILASFKTLTDEYKANLRKTLIGASDKIKELNDRIKEIEGENAIETVIERFKRLEDAISGSEAAQRLSFTFGDLDENLEAFGKSIGKTTQSLQESESYWESQADKIQAVIDKLKDQKKAILDLVSTNRNALAVSITERNISGLQGRAKAEAQYSAAQDAASQAMTTADPEEAKRLFDIARKFLADTESTAFETGALGNLQNHINYFNEQEAALYAAQEQRLAQEVDVINAEGLRQENLLKEADKELKLLDIQIRQREVAKNTYEIQRTFLEYYQKALAEIAADTKISDDERIKRTKEINRLLQEGIDKGYVPADGKFLEATEDLKKTAPLRTERDTLVAKKDEAILAASDRDNREAARNKLLEESTAHLSEAGTSLQSAAEILIESQGEVLKKYRAILASPLGAFGLAGIALNADKIDNRQDLEKLISRFEESRTLNESGALSNPAFAAILEELIKEFKDRTKGFETEDSKKAITNAERALNAITQGNSNVADIQSRIESEARDTNVNLKEIQRLTGEVKTSIDNKNKTEEEKFLDQLGTNGLVKPNQADLDAANKAAQAYKTEAEKYKERIAEEGPIPEGEVDNPGQASGSGESEFEANRRIYREIAEAENQAAREALALQQEANAITQEKVAAEKEGALSFGDQVLKVLEQIVANKVAEQNAIEKSAKNSINGVPYVDDGRNNTFNGQPIVPDGRNNMFNGQAIVEDGINNAASWAIPQAMEQGAQQSIPSAIQQGAQQSIPGAMEQGSLAIRQSIVDGMAEAFRRQQMNPAVAPVYQNPYGYGEPPQQYYAAGGPVGTDTIPAWLSPGEFVVRAQAVRKNFDVLQAINAGTFQRFSNGGSVSNSTSFSNTINMKTTNPQMQTAQLISAMKRQFSQGKATLGKGRPY